LGGEADVDAGNWKRQQVETLKGGLLGKSQVREGGGGVQRSPPAKKRRSQKRFEERGLFFQGPGNVKRCQEDPVPETEEEPKGLKRRGTKKKKRSGPLGLEQNWVP